MQFSNGFKTKKGDEFILTEREFVDNIESKQYGGLCEILSKKTQYVKPYFDIDLVYETMTASEKKAVKENAISEICHIFGCSRTDLAISSGCRPNKLSYHIIVHSTKILYKSLVAMVKDMSKKFKELHIDTSVYGTYQKIRSVYADKQGKDGEYIGSVLKPLNNKRDISKHLISNIGKILSTFDYKSTSSVKKERKTKNTLDNINNMYESHTMTSNELSELLNIIDIKYIDDYIDWRNIIYSIRSVDFSNRELAETISKKSRKYDAEGFDKLWCNYDATKSKFTIKSIYYYSMMSDYDEYLLIRSKYNNNIECTDVDMANLFYELFGNKFIYHGDVLYYFNGIYWKQDPNQHHLIEYISTNLIDYLLIKMSSYQKAIKNGENNNSVEKMVTLAENIRKIKSYNRINNISKLVLIKIQDDDIEFENNPALFVFNNVVYDLNKGEFTDPHYSDYMCMSTGYDYRAPTDKELKTVETIIEQIFPEEEVRTTYMTILASGLFGFHLEKFIMANGSGGNGKGALNEMVARLFGNYAYNGNNSVLLKGLSDGNNPSVAGMHNKRIVFYREPNAEQSKLNLDTIKELTGGCEINARMNYSNNTRTKLKATHILECNERPQIAGRIDNSAVRRLVDIPFISTFVSDPSKYKGIDHIYKGNDKIKYVEYQDKHKYALFHIILRYWEEYKGENFDSFVCKTVLDRTNEYLEDCDELKGWLDETYERSDDKTAFIHIKDMHKLFKKSSLWYSMKKDEQRMVNLKRFTENIKVNIYMRNAYKLRCKIKGKDYRNILVGFKLREEEESDDDTPSTAQFVDDLDYGTN